jgi:predicted DNA-binding ribbon-helix-helix protein
MVNSNLKVQTGLRVDKLVFDRFKELCRSEKLMVGEAVQHLMEACLEAGSVAAVLRSQVRGTVAQSKADELKLKGALAELKGFMRAVQKKEWYVTVNDKETRVDQAVYRPAYEIAVATLPKIQDAELIREAEHVLSKANEYVEKMF